MSKNVSKCIILSVEITVISQFKKSNHQNKHIDASKITFYISRKGSQGHIGSIDDSLIMNHCNFNYLILLFDIHGNYSGNIPNIQFITIVILFWNWPWHIFRSRVIMDPSQTAPKMFTGIDKIVSLKMPRKIVLMHKGTMFFLFQSPLSGSIWASDLADQFYLIH